MQLTTEELNLLLDYSAKYLALRDNTEKLPIDEVNVLMGIAIKAINEVNMIFTDIITA